VLKHCRIGDVVAIGKLFHDAIDLLRLDGEHERRQELPQCIVDRDADEIVRVEKLLQHRGVKIAPVRKIKKRISTSFSRTGSLTLSRGSRPRV